jgi:hypothetical protein
MIVLKHDPWYGAGFDVPDYEVNFFFNTPKPEKVTGGESVKWDLRSASSDGLVKLANSINRELLSRLGKHEQWLKRTRNYLVENAR